MPRRTVLSWRDLRDQIKPVQAAVTSGLDLVTGLACANALGYLGHLHAERGEFDAASRALARAAAVIGPGQSMWHGPLAEAQATAELWAGNPQTAATTIAQCLERLAGREEVYYTARLYELGIRACAELAVRAPADPRVSNEQAVVAAALLDCIDRLIAQLSGVLPPRVLAARASAAAEQTRIGGSGNAGCWTQARCEWEACGDRYQAAYARWREGEALLVQNGDRSEAETHLRTAHTVARELEARPLLDELRAVARRARIELDDPKTRGEESPATLPESELTPRELEVLAPLAGGMTNREIASKPFISHKTASAHVSHILAKLGVPNRAAAAATARHLGVG